MISDNKTTVGLLCGGRSKEHEVSLMSALSIQNALNRENYNVAFIGIDSSGRWHLSWDDTYLIQHKDIQQTSLNLSKPVVYPALNGQLIEKDTQKCLAQIDVFFPIIHETDVEDGTFQGLARLLDVPCVGVDLTGSAIAMDKDVTKRLLRDSGLPITPFITARTPQAISFEDASSHLGTPLFVKPCRMGSSLGASKITDQPTFDRAMKKAFRHDRKVIVEQAIKGKEIECTILGDSPPRASEILREIIPLEELYSYETKHVHDDRTRSLAPAELDSEVAQNVRQAAISAFTILECEGMAKIDFFIKSDGSFVINEVNTLPGFAPISMYPKLWEASGFPQNQLLDHLIKLAFERYQKEKQFIISKNTGYETAHVS